MGNLIYSSIMSLDGYMEDEDGNFDWAAPDEEVHAFVNDLMRPIGTYLYGRRMYEVMISWETDKSLADHGPITQDFAQIWQAANKIVYSSTLQTAPTARTQIEREFDPQVVRQLKRDVDLDLAVGGPDLAAQAFEAGLIDECHLFLMPIIIGNGKPALPRNLRLGLELLHEHRFANGSVFLHYRKLL